MKQWQYSRLFYAEHRKAVLFWVFDSEGQPVPSEGIFHVPDDVDKYVFKTIAVLGSQGWEMVSGDIHAVEFWFKRPLDSVDDMQANELHGALIHAPDYKVSDSPY